MSESINKLQKRVLILALRAGEIMMKSGAEVYRVEDTITRICKACKIEYVECFATTTGIFLSIDSGDSEGDMHTFIKRIRYTEINLSKISQVNLFSREFTTTDLSIEDGFAKLRAIAAQKAYSFWLNLVAAIVIGACFAPIFGGDAAASAGGAAGMAVGYAVSEAIEKLRFSDFILLVFAAAASSVTSLSLALMLGSAVPGAAIIGAIVMFMPGVALTNATRDLLSGDMSAGTARLVEAVVQSLGIAAGVMVGLRIFLNAAGFANHGLGILESPWPSFLLALGYSFGFAIYFNAPLKMVPAICAVGAFGSLASALCTAYIDNIFFTSFAGSIVVAALAEIASRAGKEATTIFVLPGIIPFVPGSGIYLSMISLIQGNLEEAGAAMVSTLFDAGAIALGLALVVSVVRIGRAIWLRVAAWVKKY